MKSYSRLKARLEKIGKRTVSGLSGLIGRLVEIFQPLAAAKRIAGRRPDYSS